MASFRYESRMPAPAHSVFDWHERPGALERLLPPWENVRIVKPPSSIRDGGTATLQLRFGPFSKRWIARHRDYEKGRGFADEQLKGPFAEWLHTRRFVPQDENSSLLDERIEYRLPLGSLGQTFGGRYAQKRLERTFRWRHQRLQQDLQRHRLYADRLRQRVVVSGASGLIGSQLRHFLSSSGHTVQRLVRRAPRDAATEIYWNPGAGELDAAALEGADVVVHLSGESVASGRWTGARKRRLYESRIASARLLTDALGRLKRPPHTFICASAIGYYGDRGAAWLDETDPAGSGFLAGLCVDWEAAAQAVESAGIRPVSVRFGLVLSTRGGALPRMMMPFRFGLGVRVGKPSQYMSWIDLDDVLGALEHVIYEESLRGPVNVVAPEPVSGREFFRSIGRVMGRPVPFAVPPAVLRLALGEMAQETLLASARVRPQKLTDRGFRFFHPTLEDALRWQLGRF